MRGKPVLVGHALVREVTPCRVDTPVDALCVSPCAGRRPGLGQVTLPWQARNCGTTSGVRRQESSRTAAAAVIYNLWRRLLNMRKTFPLFVTGLVLAAAA